MGDIKDFFRDPIGEIEDFAEDVWDVVEDNWDFIFFPANLIVRGAIWVYDEISSAMSPDLPAVPGSVSYTYQGDNAANTVKEGIPIPLAYGLCDLAGNIIRTNDVGEKNLKIQVGHCLGPVSEALAYKINDLAWDELTGSPIKDRKFYSGTTSQWHDPAFTGVSSAYRGLSYSGATFAKTTQISNISNFRITGRWRCCHEIAGSGTSVWSNNASQVMYDWYLEQEDCTEDQLETSYFQDLRDYCGTSLSGTTLSGVSVPLVPLIDSNTVTASSIHSIHYYPIFATSNKTSKIGAGEDNSWLSRTGSNNQRVSVDFGQPIVIQKLILENFSSFPGGYTQRGIKDFDIRASNDPAAFANKIVGVGGEIWENVIFDNSGTSFTAAQHSVVSKEEPQIFNWACSTAYRYWSIQIKDSQGDPNFVGIRKAEFWGYLDKRYTFDFVFDNKITKNDAKKLIWKSFNGTVINSQGKLKPVWESAKDISYSFTMDNIVQGSFKWGRPKRPNIIRVHFINLYAGNSKKDFVELKDEESIREKGEIVFEENAWYINNQPVALRRAQFFYNKFMVTDYTCELSGFPGSQGLEIYDRVTVTHPLPGWTAKDFIIRSKSEDELGRPKFQMEAYFEGLYTGEMAEPQSGYASYLPSPNITPSQVTGLTVTDASGWASDGWYIPKVNVTYTKPDNSAFWKAANLYLSNDDATWNFAGADYDGTGNVLLTSLANVETGATVFVKALSVNEMGVQAPDNESAATKSLFLYLPDIQVTFDNIPDGGTGRFIFPKGTYTQTSAVTVPDKRIELNGMQREGVIFVNNSGDQLFKLYNRTKYFEASNFTVSSANTVVFSNMFDVTGSAAVNNTADLNLQNIKFNLVDERDWAVGDGDKAVYGVNGFPRNFRISDCIINKGQQGINFEEYANIKIIGNTLIDQSVSAINILNSGENFLDISNNNIYDQRYSGIFYTTTAENVIIGNNTIQSASDGIYAQFAALLGRVQDALVNNNSITINTSSTTTQLLGIFSILSVNTEYNNNNIIIDVDTELNVYGMSLTDSKSQAINNTIRIDCSDNSMNHYGIKSNAPDCLIANNNIDMNNINAPDSMDIGINIANSITNADNNTVSNNIINNVLDYNMVVVDAGLEGVVVNGTNISGLNMTTNSEHFTKIFSRG